MSASVTVKDLRKRYGRVEALRGASFEVAAGEVFGLLGPNGAGKTTTLECLVGLRQPEAGELFIGGIDARRRPREVREKIGVALQSTALPDQITPREALRLFGSYYRERSEPAVLLERFALREKADARFASLSAGQRHRLGLALAFVNRPELVVLDEPTAGLDPSSRVELHAEIRRMKADGHTVLLATHYLEEAEQLCDRIAIVDAGRVVATGAPGELIAAAAARHTVNLVTRRPLPREGLAACVDLAAIGGEGTRLVFQTAEPTQTVAALLACVTDAGAGLVELTVRQATLEEVFLKLTRTRDAGAETTNEGGVS
ncbi:MAG TPA: ABC transporter ATP-binding protein [Opitutus sp.]|nr:ABC transporter ATP-binding protein [Opitutus sp.]